MHYRARRLLRARNLLSLLLLLPVAGFLAASPAAAQELPDTSAIDLTCTMAGNAEMSPGVSLLEPKEQQVTGVVRGGTAVSPLTPCTSLTGTPYTGFVMRGGGSGTTACATAALGSNLEGTGTVTWNNGDKSIVDWELTLVGPAPLVNATIRSGALEGHRLVVAAAPTGLAGNCILSPLTNLSFGGVIEILDAGL